MSDLPDDFYLWLNIEKNTVLVLILKETGEDPEQDNISIFLSNPISEKEEIICSTIIATNLLKVFLPCSLGICSTQTEKMKKTQQDQILKAELKKKPIPKLTEATLKGLDDLTSLNDQSANKNIIEDAATKTAIKVAAKTSTNVMNNLSKKTARNILNV